MEETAKYFRKTRMKSILAVEYMVNGSIIRTLSQLQMEVAIMSENSSHFSLANSSLIFTVEIIKKIGRFCETKEVESLIFNNIDIMTQSNEINSFLWLIY